MAETDASNEAAEPATLPEREERPDFSAVFRDADDDADAPAPDDPAPPGSATSDTIAADNATADRPSEPQQAGGAGPAGRPDMDPNSPFAALRQAVERSGSVDMAAERAAKAERADAADEGALADPSPFGHPAMAPADAPNGTAKRPRGPRGLDGLSPFGAADHDRPAARRPRWVTAGWVALPVFYLALAGGFVGFADTVASAWPASRPLYAALGMTPNAADAGAPAPSAAQLLRLSTPEVAYRNPQDPTNGLSIAVTITNPTDRRLTLPPLDGVAEDARGNVIYQWQIPVDRSVLEPGASVPVETGIDFTPDRLDTVRIAFRTDPQDG
ncbi:hypothetical protein [Rhodothalassium salexigens]|uniref:hypothetical protein n=1 Tax=Rhodothalassium salexigens TaxID=1086 RepID=UPI0018202143|nr:hypothetical protein [Rhodothalassium salexigens]MBB4210878.1 hypothetical protein [Rhodothalassium salexigens DSM 2132]